jgi:hypothetical protein
MRRFSFQGRHRRFGLNRGPRNNKGLLAGLHFGLGLFLFAVPLQTGQHAALALFGLPFLLAAVFVYREHRWGPRLVYLCAGLFTLGGIVLFVLTARLTFGVVAGFALYFLVRQATQFDAWMEARELAREAQEQARREQPSAPPGELSPRARLSPNRPPRRDRRAR